MREGQQVVVFGGISVYERSGSYQLYAREIRLDGEGVLYERFQALKQELQHKELKFHSQQIGQMLVNTNIQ